MASKETHTSKKSTEKSHSKPHQSGNRERGMKALAGNLHAVGGVLSLIQAGTAALFIYLLNSTGMIPWKYVLGAFGILAVMIFVVVLLVGIRKKQTRIAAIALSVVMIVLQLVGSDYLRRTMSLLRSSETSYKTDILNVVVRKEDRALEIADTASYKFGIVDDLSQEEKDTFLENLRRSTRQENVEYREYGTALEAARALMGGEVDAAVYREAYGSVLEEVLDSFADATRVVDSFEIRTELAYENVEPGEPFHMLISGIDVKGDISQTSRSDVNIIVTINPKTKKILMTTTPRDFYVEIPEVSNGQRDKLTHAGIYGEDASIRTLENLYGINISNYVRVNFTTLIDVVDAIDGVDIWSDYDFDCYTDSGVHINKGWNHLNGRQALAFSRERFSFPDGDNQRGKDQEQVLKAIIEKVMSPALIVNASALIESMRGSFQTDIPETKIAELISQQLSEGTDWTILRQAAESGPSGMENTFSGGVLSVTWPDMYSIKQNTARMNIILEERPVETVDASKSGT